jgi:hypothetical protein
MARRVGSPNAVVIAATLAVKLTFDEVDRAAGTPVLYLSP